MVDYPKTERQKITDAIYGGEGILTSQDTQWVTE